MPGVTDYTKLELLAWVGEDELGSGEIGIKGAMSKNGFIPMVMTGEKLQKMQDPWLLAQLKQQSRVYGKKIRLCRFVFVEELQTVEPR